MRGIQRLFKWLTAGMTIICLGLLAWQCMDIYREGAKAAADSALTSSQMYRWDDIRNRLSAISWPFFCTAIMIAASTWVCRKENKVEKPQSRVMLYQRQRTHASPVLRSSLLVLAAAFILLGVMNGGLRDVLVKAINICTECIGLG